MRYLLSLFLAAALGAASTLHAKLDTWTNLDGQSMQAEFLGRRGDYVSFRKDDGSRYLYPYAKLSEADRARVDALASTITAEPATAAVSSVPGAARPAAGAASAQNAQVGSIVSALSGKLVAPKGSSLAPVPRDQLNNVRYIAFYYSAQWCPPCRAFTPELVKTYAEIKAKHPDFELVFVSSDRDAKSMAAYMIEYGMNFPAVRFGEQRSLRAIQRPGHERGIPNLVFMDADGKELSVSYTPDGKYLGPRRVLADIRKHFKM